MPAALSHVFITSVVRRIADGNIDYHQAAWMVLVQHCESWVKPIAIYAMITEVNNTLSGPRCGYINPVNISVQFRWTTKLHCLSDLCSSIIVTIRYLWKYKRSNKIYKLQFFSIYLMNCATVGKNSSKEGNIRFLNVFWGPVNYFRTRYDKSTSASRSMVKIDDYGRLINWLIVFLR